MQYQLQFMGRQPLVGCSAIARNPNETMRLIVTTFVGVVFGFLIGASFPTLTLTKVNNMCFYHVKLLLFLLCFLHVLYGLLFHSKSLDSMMTFPSYNCVGILQLNLPSIDLSFVEDKNSGLSTQTFLKAWSSMKGSRNTSTEAQKLNNTSKVHFVPLFLVREESHKLSFHKC